MRARGLDPASGHPFPPLENGVRIAACAMQGAVVEQTVALGGMDAGQGT